MSRTISQTKKKPKVFFVNTFASSIASFRGELIKSFLQANVELVALAPDFSAETRKQVFELGATPIDYPLERAGVNPVADLQSFWFLYNFFKVEKPDLVFTFQAKPNVYGILAAYFARIKQRVAMVEGLGYVFTEDTRISMKKSTVRMVMKSLYRISLKHSDKVFFLNPDDQRDFLLWKIISAPQAVLINGIGICPNQWQHLPPHSTPLTFTLIARLLKEKGVVEFAEAARIVKRQHPDVKFLLVGPTDANPGSISENDVRQWVSEGFLEWIPWTNDIRAILSQTSIFTLPSYYREGLPRTSQEALAIGRPIITTNVPGCRETVKNLLNGLLIEPRNVMSLIQAFAFFIENQHVLEPMGLYSRKLAEEKFDVSKINRHILSTLRFEARSC